ncbi:hypothetical protein ACHHYP_08915 [Achlya hypogyna]|uniref:HhH-GPD domain-containing protein n=1 Tax=Achlya hypogyna TaxID=1202772 RepID=A0A1V9ZJT2_ACHHY|nr:hypothetical protein ACHHYP_08915 [Achlya hypogyna]
MSSLWQLQDEVEWATVLGTYDNVVGSLEEPLHELELWYHKELPALLKAQGHITQPQLARLMQWKLSKGKWRPRLQAFVDALSDDEVQSTSSKAFVAIADGQLKEAIAAISELKGVGPATASAVLAAFDSSVPFMGDEALNALAKTIGARQYTLPHFLRFATALRERASVLGASWTAQAVQRTLWLEARATASPAKPKRKNESAAQAPAKKRKR